MTYQLHSCAAYAVTTGTRCPGCGAPPLACALCGTALPIEHNLDPCPAA